MPEAIVIEEADLTKSERSDLRRDPQIRAVAPLMPVRLVKPVDSVSIGPSDAGAVWGIEVFGQTSLRMTEGALLLQFLIPVLIPITRHFLPVK